MIRATGVIHHIQIRSQFIFTIVNTLMLCNQLCLQFWTKYCHESPRSVENCDVKDVDIMRGYGCSIIKYGYKTSNKLYRENDRKQKPYIVGDMLHVT